MADFSPDRRLATVARRQAGCFTFDQALAAGFAPAIVKGRITSGTWVRLTTRVLCAATQKRTREVQAVAALLHAGTEAAFSHVTGGRLHGLDLRVADSSVWLSAPFASAARSRPGVRVVRTRHFRPADLVWGYPAVPLARTLVDLAQVLDGPALTGALYDAVRRGAVRIDDVVAEAAIIGPRRAGAGLLADVLRTFDPAFEMMVEAAVGQALADAGIPMTPQFEMYDGPFLVARLDLADDKLMLAVEIDGFASHSRRRQQRRDRVRDRGLRVLGWTTIRFDAVDAMRDLDRVVTDVLAVRSRLLLERQLTG